MGPALDLHQDSQPSECPVLWHWLIKHPDTAQPHTIPSEGKQTLPEPGTSHKPNQNLSPNLPGAGGWQKSAHGHTPHPQEDGASLQDPSRAQSRWKSWKLSPPVGKVRPRRCSHLPLAGIPPGPHRRSFPALHRLYQTQVGENELCQPAPPGLRQHKALRGQFCVSAPSASPFLQLLFFSVTHKVLKCIVKPKFKGSTGRSRLPARSSPPQITGKHFLELCVTL